MKGIIVAGVWIINLIVEFGTGRLESLTRSIRVCYDYFKCRAELSRP